MLSEPNLLPWMVLTTIGFALFGRAWLLTMVDGPERRIAIHNYFIAGLVSLGLGCVWLTYRVIEDGVYPRCHECKQVARP